MSLAPPQMTTPEAYGGGGRGEERSAGRGSYGPVIAVLVTLAVLAAAAVAVGRLCFGRRLAAGRDLEAWVEGTCGACVGGRGGGAPSRDGGGAAAATRPPEGGEGGDASVES